MIGETGISLFLSLSLSLFRREKQNPERLSHHSKDTQPGTAQVNLLILSLTPTHTTSRGWLTLHGNLTDHRVPRLNSILAVFVRVFPDEIGV